MATLPKIDFTASETCDSLGIKMTETTGMYTMPGNTGGWGAPNVGLGMAINAEIYVTVPDGTIYTLTMIPDFAGFLPSQVNGSFIIHMGLLGGTANTTMTQGLYSIRYRVLVIYGDEPEQSTWIQVQKYVIIRMVRVIHVLNKVNKWLVKIAKMDA